jgi:hypothetical protein
MPIYRVLSGPEHVIYVFAASDDEEAEGFARRLSAHTHASSAAPPGGRVRVEGLVEDDWRMVCAWGPGG